MEKRSKTLKVSALSQGDCEYVPWIRVAGKWLRNFGFELGDKVYLCAAQGQILITKKEEGDDRRKSRDH